MKLWNRMAASLATAALAVSGFGQTATPATCTTPPTGLTALNVERAIPLTDILTTLTPNVPASTLAAIAGGAVEVREILVYNPQLGTVQSTLFGVPAGSPLPTPNFNFSTGVVQNAQLKISQILFGCNPTPSMLIVGQFATGNGVYGNTPGTPAAISIGFTTDNPPKITNVAEVVAGQALAWSASATGTFTVQTPPSGGGTTPGTGPTVVVKFANGTVAVPNTTTQVGSSPFLLDATGSTGNGGLTYAWSTTSNSPVAFVSTNTPGQIFVQFPGPGDYAISLTVTDSTGAKAVFPLTLEFTGRPQ